MSKSVRFGSLLDPKNFLILQYSGHLNSIKKIIKCDSSPQVPDFFKGPKNGKGWGGVAPLRFWPKSDLFHFWTKKEQKNFLILQYSGHLNSDPKIETPNARTILRGPKSGKGWGVALRLLPVYKVPYNFIDLIGQATLRFPDGSSGGTLAQSFSKIFSTG